MYVSSAFEPLLSLFVVIFHSHLFYLSLVQLPCSLYKSM